MGQIIHWTVCRCGQVMKADQTECDRCWLAKLNQAKYQQPVRLRAGQRIGR